MTQNVRDPYAARTKYVRNCDLRARGRSRLASVTTGICHPFAERAVWIGVSFQMALESAASWHWNELNGLADGGPDAPGLLAHVDVRRAQSDQFARPALR